nr:tetratricopeptide repeat protein 28-like [Pocillopora verrucosa]
MEADENLAAADNGSPANKTSDDKDVDLDNDPLVVRAKDCFQQGNKEYRQGDFHRALQLYTEGLQLNCKDNRLTARLYNNRAAAHFRLENFENSLDDATVAVQLEPTFIKALEKGAEACVQLKLYDEAKIWCHKGLAMDDNSKRLRHLLNKCGSETIASGEIKPQQVKEVEIAKDLGDKTGEGRSYGNLVGDKEKDHKQHLEIAKEVGDKAGEGASYGNLGNAYDGLGQFKTAIEYHRRRLEIVKEVGDKDGIAQALCSLATNFERHECLQTALDYYISSREIFNNVRASFLLNHNWKISYRNVHKTAYNGVWRVLLLKGEHVKALLAAEEGRAQTLGDIVDLKYNFRQTLTRWNSRKCSDCLSLRNISSDAVFLAITGPYIALWVIRNGEVVQSRIKHVNNFLYQRELEVYITSLNKAASLQVSARAAVEWEKSSTQVGRDEKGTSDGSPRNATTNALRKLYDIIVAPIADLIDGDELVFVPEGPLCLVPYAALVDSNSRYLCESFRIRVIPSLTILKSISDCPTELHNKTGALLVGDPCYKQVLYQGNLLNQLPGARKEVKMIGGILGIAPLVGGEATKEEVLGQISSVALVHIAAHGKKETGEILLAPNTSRTTCQAEEEDYLLTMRDVLRAGLRAKLVVLSCCHSACGEVMAEGVVGIARAFLGAGARSVLVSLWAIDDDGTQEFMKHFYGALEEGKGTSEAVNQAMKCMRESEMFSKGNYWAPFVLIGDDVKLELTEI